MVSVRQVAVEARSMSNPYSHLTFAELIALMRRSTSPQAMEAAMLPPTKPEPRDVQDAARVAITHNERDE
jgi:hypothetical protein